MNEWAGQLDRFGWERCVGVKSSSDICDRKMFEISGFAGPTGPFSISSSTQELFAVKAGTES